MYFTEAKISWILILNFLVLVSPLLVKIKSEESESTDVGHVVPVRTGVA